jgi:hypothetical protein
VSQHLESKQTAKGSTTISARPERRHAPRDGVHGEPSRAHLVALVLGTYAEMPGLSLYLHQAARLFGLREATCLAVLSDLVREGRLRQSVDRQYRAANSGGV